MTCSTVTYHGITQAVFDCLKKKLTGGGCKVPSGDSGEISCSGVTAKYKWDKGAQTLAITITKLPWYASCGMATGKLHDQVKECGGK